MTVCFTPARGLARAIVRMVPVLVVVATAACHSRAEPDAHDEHKDETAAAVGSVPSCTPGHDPDLSVKARKDRIARGVFWASRRVAVDGPLEQWDTPYGPYWVVANNFNTMSEVLGEQGVEIYGDKVRGVHEGDVVLDCGAHFGGFTRTALDRGAKLVVAIENRAGERSDPQAQLRLGNRRRPGHRLREGRVGQGRHDGPGEEEPHVGRPGGRRRPGPVGRGDDHRQDRVGARLPKVDFIKMDIEGAERNALAGASETMKTFRPRMAIASYHRADDLEVLPPLALSAQPEYTACVGGRGLGHGYMTLLFR